MTAQDASAITRELLQGLLQEGWHPGGLGPDDCGEYADSVAAVWIAWHAAEHQERGTGHIAACDTFIAMNRDGRYDHLLASDSGPLDKPERLYKAQDYVDVLSKLGYSFALNACDDRIEVNGEYLTDVTEATIRSELRDLGLRYMSVARDAYIAEAARNVYHPVKRYLESLGWDGQDHIAALSSYIRDRHGVFALYIRSFLAGAVAKVYGRIDNPMLALDGSQGIGKSYFVRWLASPLPRYFVEAPIFPSSKDHQLLLVRTWIWEVGELGATTRKTDRDALKYFLTMRTVTVRKPYDRHEIVKPALASFIGTANNDGGLLDDPTGSRRFRVCTLEEINWNYVNLDVDQIWAQAHALFQAGDLGRLTADQAAVASEINAEYEIENPLHDLLQMHFRIDPTESKWSLPTTRIREHLHEFAGWGLSNPTAEATEIASALKKMGLQKTRVKDLTTQQRVNGYVGIKKR